MLGSIFGELYAGGLYFYVTLGDFLLVRDAGIDAVGDCSKSISSNTQSACDVPMLDISTF